MTLIRDGGRGLEEAGSADPDPAPALGSIAPHIQRGIHTRTHAGTSAHTMSSRRLLQATRGCAKPASDYQLRDTAPRPLSRGDAKPKAPNHSAPPGKDDRLRPASHDSIAMPLLPRRQRHASSMARGAKKKKRKETMQENRHPRSMLSILHTPALLIEARLACYCATTACHVVRCCSF
jgi:hypothetical protein